MSKFKKIFDFLSNAQDFLEAMLQTNQIFGYTRFSKPKRVTSCKARLRHCARATQLLWKKYCSGGNTVSDLISPRF